MEIPKIPINQGFLNSTFDEGFPGASFEVAKYSGHADEEIREYILSRISSRKAQNISRTITPNVSTRKKRESLGVNDQKLGHQKIISLRKIQKTFFRV